jgi:Uma2 family endonuclease
MATATVEVLAEEQMRVPPIGKVTFAEFIEWCDEDIRAEWVDGDIELMPSPVSLDHQDIGGFLDQTLGIYVSERDLGKVVLAPYVMHMAQISRGREPDLIFVKQERLPLLTRLYLDGPADLAIEIVSPSSLARDTKIKLREYERAGVEEYWVLNPDKQTAVFYQLEGNKYRAVSPDRQGIYHSRVVAGYWLRVASLWQQPLPKALDVLRELGVI